MANVQKENGYTATANTLVEAICCLEVGGACHRILRFIERKTYGYRKKEDSISLTQFEKGTGLHRVTVTESLDTLEGMKVVIINRDGYINVYKINKDFDTWTSNQKRTSSQNLTSKQNLQDSSQNLTKTSSQNLTYKRKKQITKEISKTGVLQINKKDMGWKNNQGDEPDIPSIGDDGEIEKLKEKPKKHYKEIYTLFEEILGKDTPANWIVNKNQHIAAENLYTERGIKAVRNALQFYKEKKDEEFCPQITSPYDLDSKWTKLATFKSKHGN